MKLVETVQLSHIWWEDDKVVGFHSFHAHTAFVISHKHESLETLLGVLWFLPVHSPILVVTNCPVQEVKEIKRGLVARLPEHHHVYLLHQKDVSIARLFDGLGVHQLLGSDGRVLDGKGEGMYIGTLGAVLLGYPERVIFFDADNLVPSALMEYTMAMRQLFLAAERPAWQNVRIFWASKPRWEVGENLSEKVLGRCSGVVSPVIDTLLQDRFGQRVRMMVSNAGEQGLSIAAAHALRFSSGYSVETFQLLDLLAKSAVSQAPRVLIQQYEARSPHFHQKGDDEHIREMIAQSLGCFFLFEPMLTDKVRRQLWQLYEDLRLPVTCPRVYPALKDLSVQADAWFMERFRLHQAKESLAAGLLEDEGETYAS